MSHVDNLVYANQDRVADAAGRVVPAAVAALESGRLPGVLAAAARLRVRYPDASLRDLANTAGVSKDTFAARLRRAIAVGRQFMEPNAVPDPEPRKRVDWAQLAVRVTGGFLTMPTTQTLRATPNAGMRIIAATNIIKALQALEDQYRGVLEDAAVEKYHETVRESSRDTRKSDVRAAVAARSDLIDPDALARRITAEQGRELRLGWYTAA